MVAKIEISADYDVAKILELAGAPSGCEPLLSGKTLSVIGVSQQALDSALASYDHAAVVRKNTIAEFISTLERHYDSVAQQRLYDNRLTCALRAGYEGPFRGEGVAFATWMDGCNAYAYAQMAAVLAAERQQPTPQGLIDELPAISWP